MAARRALITGITGQDGSYLADALVAEGTEVVGLVRSEAAARERPELAGVAGAVRFVEGALEDRASLRRAIAEVVPDELYHLAAPTFVPTSWEDPSATMDAIAGATATILAGVLADAPAARVYVASSSEVFGDADAAPQHEGTAMRPRSPYGVAKLAALGLCRVMRAHHGLFVSAGITYNHESPRRPERFLPRKVTRGAASIALGLQDELALGDLGAVRDWSHARDVVRAAMLMLRADAPDDYVVASGVGRTVGDLVEAAFARAGVEVDGHVRVDPAFVRAPEAVPSIGDPSKARDVLGWTPATTFDELIGEMVDADLAELRATAG